MSWVDICSVRDLISDGGICAQVDGHQVAVFQIGGETALYALDNVDPFSGAAVLSRGIVGDVGGEPVVASPVYKQHFRLRDGQCVEDDTVKLRCFAVRLSGERVEVASA